MFLRRPVLLALLLAGPALACDTEEARKAREQAHSERVAELEAQVDQQGERLGLLSTRLDRLEARPVSVGAAAPERAPVTAAIEVTANDVRLDGQSVELSRLSERLREQAARIGDAGLVLTVRAGNEVAHARVLEVVEAAKAAGIEKVGISVEGRAPTGP